MKENLIKFNQFEYSLNKKGFEGSRYGRHTYRTLANKLTFIHLQVTNSDDDILDDFFVDKMSKAMYISKPNFIRFVICDMDQKEYEDNLKHFKILK